MRFHRRLAFFLLMPIVAFVLAFGAVSFFSLYLVAKRIVEDQAETGLRFRAETVSLIAESGIEELRRSGRAGDAVATRERKEAAVAAIDRVARTGVLRIAIVDGDAERMHGLGQLDAIPPSSAIVNDDQVHVFDVDDRLYYTYSFRVEDWNWQVSIVKDADAYELLRRDLVRLAILAAVTLTVGIGAFLFYLTAITRRPIKHIIGALAADRPPRYTGIEEFEYLSQSIAAMMQAVREKNEALASHSNQLEHLVRERTAELARTVEELRQANIDIRNAQQQLLQSEKLVSIGQLAAGVAHEINNPLGFVKSNLGALEGYIHQLLSLVDAYECHRRQPADDDSRRALDEAKRRADLDFIREDLPALLGESKDGVARVKKIVEDLRTFSHIEEVEWRPFDVHSCLDTTLGVLGSELQEGIALVRDYGDLPEIECLPAEIDQVLFNLLMNARQAIGEKGSITVRTRARGDEVEIEIGDDGCGIAPEHLGRIFDPFFTTKPIGAGSGLGLSLSYNIVMKHHGRIEVASTLGRGATFCVILPVRQPALPATSGPL